MSNPTTNSRTPQFSRFLRLGLCAALAACADQTPTGDDPSLEPAPSEIPDGTKGWITVTTPHGTERLPYVAQNGHAVYEGDMDLGPIPQGDERLRGGALSRTATRWTGTVEYAFHPDFSGNSRSTVRSAIANLEARLPLDFREVTYGQHTGPWIEFKWSSGDETYSGMSSAVGMMGCGELHGSTEGEWRNDCGQWIYFNPSKGSVAESTAQHEILHALGMFHEQSRNDRDEFVSVREECMASDAAQFAIRSESMDLGPTTSSRSCITTRGRSARSHRRGRTAAAGP